ncbi:hypothetical protein D3C72_2358140 [compost metagenome]
MSSPEYSALPDVGVLRRSNMRAMLDFPDPDSPTIPTVSPRWRVKLTSSTARNSPLAAKVPEASI